MALLVSSYYQIPIFFFLCLQFSFAWGVSLSPVLSYEEQFKKRTVGVDPDFNCAWSVAAYEYALNIQPNRGSLQSVYDALQLQLCNQSLLNTENPTSLPVFPTPTAGSVLYIDYVQGSDSNSGTISSPLKTILTGVAVSRSLPHPVTLLLREGVHVLNQTVEIEAQDSWLTIQNYNGENVTISGAQPLKTAWQPYNVSSASWEIVTSMNAVYGGSPGPNFFIYGEVASAQDCLQACQGNASCTIWTWHDPLCVGYANQCWFRLDGQWDLTPEADHISGCKVGAVDGCFAGMNVYMADLSGQGLSAITGLQVGGPGVQRAIRARYPNANPETDLFPVGWITDATTWTPPMSNPPPIRYIFDSVPVRNESVMFNNFMLGIGGQCYQFEPPISYWCSETPSGGGAFTYRVPTGITYQSSSLPHAPYTHNPLDANFHVWRPAHWANWMFNVGAYNAENNTFAFSEGGFQGARGDDTGGEWFIENQMEELDFPTEFYYDERTQILYYYHNGTGAPPSELEFVAPNVKVFFNVTGSMAAPVVGFTIQGVTIAASELTYMDAHGVPSGGDWALDRIGAVFVQGTENTTLNENLFIRLDGNAVFLSGYNRNATITNNEFVWIGDNAIASWGYTEEKDPAENLPYGDGLLGVNGDQPRFSYIAGNLIHELGHYEKQSSCYFQAKTAQTTLSKNICFNIPRAGFNINDGFGGGNELAENLLFNTCRESSDHGPFNSWDREPFLTDVATGYPSLVPAYNQIHHNFMVANYGGDGGCVDNDDGSSWYMIFNNFFVFGGHKSDFGGHNKMSYGNINAYPQVYGPRCVAIMGMPLPGFNEGYWNNTCILDDTSDVYAYLSGCNPANKTTLTLTSHDNRLYAPNEQVVIQCGVDLTLQQWQAIGMDPGTTVSAPPSSAQIIEWARELLSF